ncbi:N-acyl homoserine lactone hydrolase [Minicystis rosea]|nr:N-acyl homoserine lactone hydrolase [Minicystis rosea]
MNIGTPRALLRGLVLSIALSSAACSSMGIHDVRPLDVSPAALPRPSRWEDVFAHPTALRVTAFNTGEVYTGTKILIEGDNPRTPPQLKQDQWVPAIAYLVEHPTQGRVLFDTGVPSSAAGKGCDFGRWPLFSVPCRSAPDQNVAAQLAARGVHAKDLRFVAVSHFHGDHIGGLEALLGQSSVPVVTTREEWSAVERTLPSFEGYLTELINGTYPIRTLPAEAAVDMPGVGRVLDLFGDASVWLIPASATPTASSPRS